MQRIRLAVLGMALVVPLAGYAQTGTAATSAEPFKVGTFRIGTTQTIGIVLRDSLVVDVVQANAALEKSRSFPARRMPSEMVEFIADYENGLKGRVYAIVNELVQSKALDGKTPGLRSQVDRGEDARADPAPAADHDDGGQFLQPYRGERGARCAREGDRRTQSQPRRPLHVSQVAIVGHRHRRHDSDPARTHGTGLGDRAGDDHRQARHATSPHPRRRTMCSATP